jgi:hypothetical protein
MPKQLTNEVPLQILTAKEYCFNSMLRKNSAFIKGVYIIGKHEYTPQELEIAFPITHVKVVPRIHPQQPSRQK